MSGIFLFVLVIVGAISLTLVVSKTMDVLMIIHTLLLGLMGVMFIITGLDSVFYYLMYGDFVSVVRSIVLGYGGGLLLILSAYWILMNVDPIYAPILEGDSDG